MNHATFFAAVARAPFGGPLTTDQVEGTTAILAGWDGLFPHGDGRWLAYALGTAFHESGRAMVSIEENLDYSAERLLEVWPQRFAPAEARRYAHHAEAIANRAYANRGGNGDEASGDGWRYRGRGPSQITFKGNYRKASQLVDVDLVHEPEAALEPDTAVAILLLGMARGLFTGRKLGDYFSATAENWRGARRIIGLDKAELVAMYARAFHTALTAAAERTLRVTAPPLTGPDVVIVQEALRRRSIDPGLVDGAYGPKTAAAVRRFQAAIGLVADGVVGPATRTALGAS